jgi:hypothetical protein
MLASTLSLQQYLFTLPPAELAAAKSELFNIFRANPWLSKFYTGFFDLYGSNPPQSNNLQTRSGNFFNPDLALTPPEGSNSMAVNKAARLCTHIKVNGIPCGSLALRGEAFCYFHQRLIRGVPTPPESRLHPMAFLEDAESIQASLMETINALVRNTIDFRRAQLILRALHIAAKNAPRASFELWQHKMVNEVPSYPAAPAAKPPDPALDQAGVLARAGRPRLPKPVSIAPPPPPIAASVDPTRPKPPARATAASLVKSQVANARAVRATRDYRHETGVASSQELEASS